MELMPKITVFRKNVARKKKLQEFTNVESMREWNDPQRKEVTFLGKLYELSDW